MAIDKETATLLAAAIAATAALSNTVITTWRQSRLEERRWDRARKDEQGKWQQQRQDEANASLRSAIASLAQQLATCVQTVAWFTWKAGHAPDSLTPEEIEKYNTDMKALLPTLVSGHLLVVALDPKKDAAIRPLVDAAYNLDHRTALASLELGASRPDGLKMLWQCFVDSEEFLTTLHDRFAGILTDAQAAETPPIVSGKVTP